MNTRAEAAVQEVFRKDYLASDFVISDVSLYCDLYDDESLIHAELKISRLGESAASLVLNGESMELRSISIDGQDLTAEAYSCDDQHLTIHQVPDEFTLNTVVMVKPQENTSLNGLYQTSGNYCTQCEAMGFRKITYFLDRPDNMARFMCTVVADEKRFPVLLSNGNRIDSGAKEDGRHFVTWEDPFPKPCYLFALVAGNLMCHSGTFTTMTGREVALEIWVEPQNIDKCEHALRSLQKSMQWDEEVFGREYDLDIYMIVAVNDFNMGAMENKGLNVFNSKFVLALPETATDMDYENIEAVIAHEYFHNWTGNRVTCRDWFQLTLKEGLTVFRDQQFTADMTSAAVKRIDDVRQLRLAQFPEDRGPMSHPIRPDSYISMDNFYTMTVYEKGAEVIRMYHSILGAAGFRKGMDLYFERHDGAAVTCDDFRAAMADANDYDLDQFANWYAQRGTPLLEISEQYDETTQQLKLNIVQSIPCLADGEAHSLPLHIPVNIGLLAADGSAIQMQVQGLGDCGISYVYHLKDREQALVFEKVAADVVPSILREFSAPVTIQHDVSTERLAFLMAHDSDSFNRWQAGQTLITGILQNCIAAAQNNQPLLLPLEYVDAYGQILSDESLDGAMFSLMMLIPQERELALGMEEIDVDAIHQARVFVCTQLVQTFHD
ncbi:MAG: aminopeptidase N, partial [Planctomycetes bacterium]|nr:aminopeptidase N [Planctomycetota bacterium]